MASASTTSLVCFAMARARHSSLPPPRPSARWRSRAIAPPATWPEPMDQVSLAYFWAAVIAGSILIYVILDGFDLGVGILFGWTGDEDHRRQMMNVIAPFWDGNETWLVLIGAALFGAFPKVYAIFLPAFYLPVLLLLLALIFRGVAFEFRYRTTRM